MSWHTELTVHDCFAQTKTTRERQTSGRPSALEMLPRIRRSTGQARLCRERRSLDAFDASRASVIDYSSLKPKLPSSQSILIETGQRRSCMSSPCCAGGPMRSSRAEAQVLGLV
jgi:hypothetical protein